MPIRTNAFQKLIVLINEQIADEAQVEESVPLHDSVTGELREVDILVKGRVGDYETSIGVECTERKRKVTSPWVESMKAKFEHLPIDKVVLVTNKGFYEPALIKAKHYNMLPLTLKQANEINWLSQLDKIILLDWGLERIHNRLQLSDVPTPGSITDPIVFCGPDDRCIAPHQFLHVLQSTVISCVGLQRKLPPALQRIKSGDVITISIDIPSSRFREWYVPDSHGGRHKLRWYHLDVRATMNSVSAKLQRARYQGRNVAYAISDTIVVSFVEQAESKVSVGASPVSSKKYKHHSARYIFVGGEAVFIDTPASRRDLSDGP